MDNYLKKLLDFELPKGEVMQTSIMHDEWCLHNTGGQCTCDPDIAFVKLNRITKAFEPYHPALRDKGVPKTLVIKT